MRVIAADGSVSYVDDVISAEYTQAAEAEGVSRVMGSGSEAAKGITWSKQQRGGGTGRGPNDDGGDDDDDEETFLPGVNDVRSRLARAFELDSAANIVVPPNERYGDEYDDGDGDDNMDGGLSLDIGLGVSLQAELQAQLQRREARLGDLRAAADKGESVPEATLARVSADVDALKRELRAFSGDGGSWYAAGAESRLVSRTAMEVTRAGDATRDKAASGGYLDAAGEWAEVSEAAAAVTRLDVAIEKLAAAASVTGKPVDWAEMNELKEQRTVWGLRLVSAQIKGIMGLQSAVLNEEGEEEGSAAAADDDGTTAGPRRVKKRNLTAEMKRLEKLTAEKSALLERLSETERRGSLASSAAAELKSEVESLRAQLAATKKIGAAGQYAGAAADDASWQAKWADDRVALEKRLRRAEAKKALVEIQAENEVSVLWAEVKRLQGLLGEKESNLERIKWDANMSLLQQIDADPLKNISPPEAGSFSLTRSFVYSLDLLRRN